MTGVLLGPTDELPQLRTYTTLLLGFSLKGIVEQADIIERLQAATDTLIDNFPFLGGHTTIQDVNGDTLNATKFVPGSNGYQVKVKVNDVSELFPSYDIVRRTRAPASVLDGAIVGEGESFPAKRTGTTLDPCLRIRATFVQGGLLLTFALIHVIGDGNSLGQVIKMFATACRGDKIPSTDIEAGNVDRQGSLPSLQPHEHQLDHSNMMVKVAADADPHAIPDKINSNPISWAYYHIPQERLVELKAEASGLASPDDTHVFVSTNDAVTVLVWRTVTKARLPRLDSNDQTSLMRAINSRRKLNPPLAAETIQNVITFTYTASSLEEVATKLPLSTLAIQMRKDLEAIDDHHVRSLMTFLRGIKNKSSVAFGADHGPNDIVVSSFAKFPIWGDFGPLLGKPEFVRRPTLTPMDGLVYIMPRNPDGSLDVAISIRNDDMERMRMDEKWNYYTEFIG